MKKKKTIQYRDLKTGRLAPAWKARRWPKRFVDDRKFFRAKQAKKIAEGPPPEVSEKVKNRVAEIVFEYGLGSTLFENFDFTGSVPSVTGIRGHADWYGVVWEVPSFSAETPEARFFFKVNVKTKEMRTEERPPTKPEGERRRKK